MTPDRIRQWHRLFGITLTDLFRDTPWQVELEKELALQSQLLDVVIIEQTAARTPAAVELPDGLDGLRAHNLLTYKSHHEALDGWALDELIGHYVNYRKLTSPPDRLIRRRSSSSFMPSPPGRRRGWRNTGRSPRPPGRACSTSPGGRPRCG